MLNAKAAVVDKYTRDVSEMTAVIDINKDPKHRDSRTTLPLLYKFWNLNDKEEDVRKLAEDCTCHHFNKFGMQDSKRNKPMTCRVRFGDEKSFKNTDTSGMAFIEQSSITWDKK